MVPQIGIIQARTLLEHLGSAEAVFRASHAQLERIERIGTVRAHSIKTFSNFEAAEAELRFIDRHKIQPLLFTDAAYPQRLLHCFDPPTILYYRGQANLNASRVVSIIGTRSSTSYGKQLTEKFIEELAAKSVTVISGLAFGIDAIAHKAALRHNLPTVAVLAHGLDHVYPPEHHALARDILKCEGGLLTEFRSNTPPDRHNFPTRNRIVAGTCDAVIVVESGLKGGSMVTAELANGYNKDVFAFPGRITDNKSAGCNHLIRTNKAVLLSGAEDLFSELGWTELQAPRGNGQKTMFLDFTPEEEAILAILRDKRASHIDEINFRCSFHTSKVAAAILNLELQNVIQSLPGKMYRIA